MAKTSATPPGAEEEGSKSEQLFQALERFIDDKEATQQTLERIEEQAREGNGNALRGLTEEAAWSQLINRRPPQQVQQAH